MNGGPLPASGYRPEIDGLRAVAVLAVIGFHLLPGWLPGGFVGVDIFFVISGYLITGIIAGDVRAGTFSWAGFYERRARRLLPAMFAVTAVIMALTHWLFLPEDLARTGSTGFSALLSWSNIWLERTQDYFAPSAALNPFLHTWSLSVEEQFYIVAVPLVLLLCWRDRGGRRLGWGLLILTVLSLAISGWSSWKRPDAAYFLLFNRAWELLLGALLVILRLPALARWQRECLVWGGLAAIAVSLGVVTEQTPFPVWGAVPACVGTVLILCGGQGPGAGHRLLSLPPCRWVGRISYSLYLWHWPVIVVAGYVAIDDLSPGQRLACLLPMVLLAWASHRWVEQPFRRPVPGRRTRFLLGCAVVAGLLAGVCLAAWRSGGWPQRLDERVRRLSLASRQEFTEGILLSPAQIAAGTAVPLGRTDIPPSFLLWGDSHGNVARPIVDRIAADHGLAGSFLGAPASMPVLGLKRRDNRFPDYEKRTQAILAYIDHHPSIHYVVLWACWDLNRATACNQALRPEQSGWQTLAIALQETIAVLHRSGREVIIVPQMPRLHANPSTVARRIHLGLDDPAPFTREDFAAQRRPFMAIIDQLAGQPGWSLMDPSDSLFDADGRLQLVHDGELLYWDTNHLSDAGAACIRPQVERGFARLGLIPAAPVAPQDPPPAQP